MTHPARQHDHPLWRELDRLQMNVNQLAAQVVGLRAIAAGLNLAAPTAHKCPLCEFTFRRLSELEAHAYHHHDGPLPAAWAAADRRAAPVEEPVGA